MAAVGSRVRGPLGGHGRGPINFGLASLSWKFSRKSQRTPGLHRKRNGPSTLHIHFSVFQKTASSPVLPPSDPWPPQGPKASLPLLLPHLSQPWTFGRVSYSLGDGHYGSCPSWMTSTVGGVGGCSSPPPLMPPTVQTPALGTGMSHAIHILRMPS